MWLYNTFISKALTSRVLFKLATFGIDTCRVGQCSFRTSTLFCNIDIAEFLELIFHLDF